MAKKLFSWMVEFDQDATMDAFEQAAEIGVFYDTIERKELAEKLKILVHHGLDLDGLLEMTPEERVEAINGVGLNAEEFDLWKQELE